MAYRGPGIVIAAIAWGCGGVGPAADTGGTADDEGTTATAPPTSTGVDDGVDVGSADDPGDDIAVTVIMAGDGTGTVSIPGAGMCTRGTCVFYLEPNGATLTAQPAGDSAFAGWSGDCSGTALEFDLDTSSPRTCTATFVQLMVGRLDADVTASREVARVPARDAPASDSDSILDPGTGPEIVSWQWTVQRSDDHRPVFTSRAQSPTFTCPPERAAYDVHLTISDGTAYSRFAHRRLVTCVPPRSDAGRTVHHVDLAQGSYLQEGMIDGVPVQPGDLVRVSGTATGNFALFNFQGTAQAPIHVINDGLAENPVGPWLLHLINCQHVIIDGFGDDTEPYGFVLGNNNPDGAGQGVFIRNYTQGANVETGWTGIEIFGVHVTENPGTGLQAITQGSAAYNRDNFMAHDLRIHHVRIEDVGLEGFYLGYFTDADDLDPPPFQIEDTKVYRNEIHGTGWDGLQVANSPVGLEVHDNVVDGTGLADEANQRSSIQFNAGNAGAVFANRFTGHTSDFQVGCTGGDVLVFANVFDHDEAGMYVHAGLADPAPRWSVFGNTMISPTEDAVRFNETSEPGCTPPGAPIATFHVADNLFVLPAGQEPFSIASGDPDQSGWVLTPNLDIASTDEVCVGDDLVPTCTDAPLFAADLAPLSVLGLDREGLPLGVLTDGQGRVIETPAAYGAYQ